MSEIVNFADLRPGDVTVLSGGVVCTVVELSGRKVLFALGAGAATNLGASESVWDKQIFPPDTKPEDMNLLVLYRAPTDG